MGESVTEIVEVVSEEVEEVIQKDDDEDVIIPDKETIAIEDRTQSSSSIKITTVDSND